MNNATIKKSIELAIHVFLVVAVPFIYLEIATGFNKYRLPEHMPVVYVYWLVYIFIIAVIYGMRKKRQKYQPPKCTEKYTDL